MSVWVVRNFVRKLQAGWIHAVFYICFTLQIIAEQQCSECPYPKDTLSSRINRSYIYTYNNNNCTDNETTYQVESTCNRGFQQNGDNFTSTCTCNAETCEWKSNGSCQIEVLPLIVAVIIMIISIVVFSLIMVLLWKRYTKRHKKAMYDASLDVSEVIDGHLEKGGGVVNIGMTDIPPSPRIIPIEDPFEMDCEVGVQTSWGNETEAEVHSANASTMANMNKEVHYANASAMANMNKEVHYANASAMANNTGFSTDGNGYDSENGMVPSDPQAGTSTEKLLDTERDEPDGQVDFLDPYASIGDRPIDSAWRGNSDASVGGSVKVRPVTAPPVFKDRSTSVRTLESSDEAGVDALYAKINKVKRASSRWPPGTGSWDPKRPRGRPADLGDLLNHIDKPTSPTQPTANAIGVEDLYAEVDMNKPDDWASNSVKANPIPTAPKPARYSSKTPGRREIKRYAPPSGIQVGDSGYLYAEVDKSRPFTERNIVSSNFTPPSPPPLSGMDGLYAQIDHDRSSKDPSPPGVGDGNRDSPNIADEGFVDHATTRV